MSTQEIRAEIDRALDKLSPDSLEALLELLRGFENNDARNIFEASAVSKVLSEDNDLLQKLAK